ncbi:hypothetical protein J6590_061533 [Homalodisca vitripennis]|nr:hypothetical protein J6590_061533 [Homalodisca vitripennis]
MFAEKNKNETLIKEYIDIAKEAPQRVLSSAPLQLTDDLLLNAEFTQYSPFPTLPSCCELDSELEELLSQSVEQTMTELDSSVSPDLPEITPLCTDTCHSAEQTMTELDSSVYPDLPEITPLCTDTCHSAEQTMTELDSSVYPDLPEITPLCTDTCHRHLPQSAQHEELDSSVSLIFLRSHRSAQTLATGQY